MAFLSEAAVEQALLDQLHALDYQIEREEDIGPDGHRPERENHAEVILKPRFEAAIARLNPGLPREACQEAMQDGVEVLLWICDGLEIIGVHKSFDDRL